MGHALFLILNLNLSTNNYKNLLFKKKIIENTFLIKTIKNNNIYID
jgi:hypothetical protein